MSQQPTFDEVKHFLGAYSTEPGPYDFNGLLHLVLAGVDNLREHAIDQDFEDFACAITQDQATFLQRLLEHRARSNAQLEKDK
jgi:hypothetical protein